jgi:RNA polymerase nonessential primary-like sigma factor
MPAQPFYADAEYDDSANVVSFQFGNDDNRAELDETQIEHDLADLEMEYAGAGAGKSTGRRTTDLVRLYLQEIGRVRLLGRDEEVSEAQSVQRYMRLVELRNATADTDAQIKQYVQLIETHDRLVSSLGHRPSWERWAAEAEIAVIDLNCQSLSWIKLKLKAQERKIT